MYQRAGTTADTHRKKRGRFSIGKIIPESIDRFTFMTSPAGGFFTFGLLMALVIFIETKLGESKKRSIGCEGCPSKGACGAKGGNE